MMLVAQVDSPLADAQLIGDRGLSGFVRVLTRLSLSCILQGIIKVNFDTIVNTFEHADCLSKSIYNQSLTSTLNTYDGKTFEMEDPEQERLKEQSNTLRVELKIWEKSFASANNGSKASRQDIKKNLEIGISSFPQATKGNANIP